MDSWDPVTMSAVTVSAEEWVGAGERSEADSLGAAPWVVAFEERLAARERAWRRGRRWGWVGMGVGNLVVADVFVYLVFMVMFASGPMTRSTSSLHDLSDLLLDLLSMMAFLLREAILVWLVALGLSYAMVRVMRVVAARGQG